MTTITTGPNGEALFDGMNVEQLIEQLRLLTRPFRAPTVDAITAALRHLSAQPDPLTVTGRLRWDKGNLYVGAIKGGRVFHTTEGVWVATVRDASVSTGHATEAEARAALVQAVKEAIGG